MEHVPHFPTSLWAKTILFGYVIFLIATTYEWIYYGQLHLSVLYHGIADTAFVLIGLSLSLGSISYFWNALSPELVYRKYFGLWGYALVILAGTLSLFVIPELSPFHPYPFSKSKLLPYFITVPSIVVYTVMALISNSIAIKILGGKRWRLLLRVGYVAFFFTTLHFSFKSYLLWIPWFLGKQVLPPSSIILVLFGIFVLSLRVFAFTTQNQKIRAEKPLLEPIVTPGQEATSPQPNQ